MPLTCDDCGEAFETLSRLRLHDCPEDESTAGQDMFETDSGLSLSTVDSPGSYLTTGRLPISSCNTR